MTTLQEMKSAYERGEPFQPAAPAGIHTPLPLRRTFYPLGFPVEIVTNAEEVLHAAEESWHSYTPLFDMPPFQFRIIVVDNGASECPPRPKIQVQQHLSLNVADSDNYAITDMQQGVTVISLSRAALAHTSHVRYFYLESSAMCLIAARHATAIHAACVELDGRAILLCGDSGAGKSTLSYACAQAGWTYITDDASFLVLDCPNRMVVGNFRQVRFRPTAAQLFPELESRQIMRKAEVGKPSIELMTTPLTHLRRAPSAHVAHLVFLNRNTSTQELVEFPKEVARAFIRQTLFPQPDVQAKHEAAIDGLLQTGCLELRYQSLDFAIARLTQLVKEGR